MMKQTLCAISCLTIMTASGGAAQTSPAELPPEGFAGRQFIDSAGCVFIRGGADGAWQPRSLADGSTLCGFVPTFPPAKGSAEAKKEAPIAVPKPKQPAQKAEATPKPKTADTPKTEAKAAPKAEAKPKAQAKPKAEVKPKLKAEAKAAPKAQAKPKADTEAKKKTAAATTPKSEAKADPKTDAKTEAKPKAEAKATTDAKAKPKTDAKAKPKTQANPKTTTKTETKPKAKAAVAPAPKAQASSPQLATPAPNVPVPAPKVAAPAPKVAAPAPKTPAPAAKASPPVETVNMAPKTATPVKPVAGPKVVQPKITGIEGVVASGTAPSEQIATVDWSKGSYLQIAAFRQRENTLKTKAKIEAIGLPVALLTQTSQGRPLEVVLVGPFKDDAAAREALRKVRSAGYADAFTRRK